MGENNRVCQRYYTPSGGEVKKKCNLMETEKRKLSTRRLYKSVWVLVIVISILSGLLAFIHFENAKFYRERVIKSEEESPFPKATDKLFQNLRRDRLLAIIGARKESRRMALIFSAIAVGLPIIFFGGTGLYRYLFPIQKESK